MCFILVYVCVEVGVPIHTSFKSVTYDSACLLHDVLCPFVWFLLTPLCEVGGSAGRYMLCLLRKKALRGGLV